MKRIYNFILLLCLVQLAVAQNRIAEIRENLLGNVLIPRYAPNALTENNILGTGAGQVQPDYVLLSHILEMAHAGVDASRWSLDMALERASKINCDQTYVPMWGEKMVWKNGKLN